MSIDWKVLGRPGEDNAIHLKIDTGQSIHPVLIDCGENVLDTLRISEIQAIEQLCLSHLHMDHICGFDTFFRHNYNRSETPVFVWGPEDTSELLHHRFRSFVWNLHHEQPGEWVVHDLPSSGNLEPKSVETSRFYTREAFDTKHPRPERSAEGSTVLKTSAYEMKALSLPHHTTRSICYHFQEAPKQNVDPEALQSSGLKPGPWLQALIDTTRADDEILPVGDLELTLGEVRKMLLIENPGASLAFLTDFRVELSSPGWNQLVDWLQNTDVLICESQYRSADGVLARKNGHMTSDLTGELAKASNVGELVLHHLSRRYRESEWREMLMEVRKIFPATTFPSGWSLIP